MKYKLINEETKEEYLCEKISIDGFDYYVIDGLNNITTDNIYIISKRTHYLGKTFYPKNDGTVSDETIKELLLSVYFEGHYETTVGRGYDYYKVIATSNTSLDIPIVIDEVDEYANYIYPIDDKYKEKYKNDYTDFNNCWKEGYNKCKETNPYSVEFIDWIDERELPRENNKWIIYFNDKDNYVSTKELLEIWEQQRTITIYFK